MSYQDEELDQCRKGWSESKFIVIKFKSNLLDQLQQEVPYSLFGVKSNELLLITIRGFKSKHGNFISY